MRFVDRTDAALQLADRLKSDRLTDPLVLGIPRGGMVIAAVLARELGAELDIVLSRKLPTPGQPELAIGAVSEDGHVVLNEDVAKLMAFTKEQVEEARLEQMLEIERRVNLFRQFRPKAPVEGRTVIVTDDGIATGATMIAALQELRTKSPRELVAAIPVSSTSRLAEVTQWCDRAVCLYDTENFYAVGQFYDDFRQVSDEDVLSLLKASSR